MAKARLVFANLPEFLRDMDKSIRDLDEETKQVEVKEARQKVKPKIKSSAPKKTGKLRSSVRVIDNKDFTGVIVDTPYATSVHYGRRKFGLGRGKHAIKSNPWIDRLESSLERGLKKSLQKMLNSWERKSSGRLNR